jgi:hypothetical protein
MIRTACSLIPRTSSAEEVSHVRRLISAATLGRLAVSRAALLRVGFALSVHLAARRLTSPSATGRQTFLAVSCVRRGDRHPGLHPTAPGYLDVEEILSRCTDQRRMAVRRKRRGNYASAPARRIKRPRSSRRLLAARIARRRPGDTLHPPGPRRKVFCRFSALENCRKLPGFGRVWNNSRLIR